MLVNQKESSTFKVVQKGGFNITYLDSRNIQGDYVKDIVHIGDISIKGQQLGLAHKSVRPTGIMGLGFSSNVAAEHHYATIVDNLVSQGFIDSAAFSLYMVSTRLLARDPEGLNQIELIVYCRTISLLIRETFFLAA